MLAVPCLLILGGVAEPHFSLGTRATQSPVVLISQTHTHDPFGLASILPITLLERQYRRGVVPVLQDERWSFQNPLVAAAYSTGSIQEIERLIGEALRQSFTQAGWS